MVGAIYLSVNRSEQGDLTDEAYMDVVESVQAAILSFIDAFLGRRHLIWCGHPEIASLISHIAKDYGIDERSWITVYKPRKILKNLEENGIDIGECKVIPVDSMKDSSDPYFECQEKMFSENEFSHAVFIGGDKKSIGEYEQFKRINPKAKIIPFTPSGGATREIAKREGSKFDENLRMVDYILTFFDEFEIDVNEERRAFPDLEVGRRKVDTVAVENKQNSRSVKKSDTIESPRDILLESDSA